MPSGEHKKSKAIRKELLDVERREQRLRRAALKAAPAASKTTLEKKIPEKIYSGLKAAFCKGFSIIFYQGRAIIEKGYRKDDIKADHVVLDFAVQVKGSRKELKKMAKWARQSDAVNLAATTVEGIGLGALGIGMPDIVLFLGVLLKGVYVAALSYGFDYEPRQEQLLILKMMEASLSSGTDWARRNAEVDEMLTLKAIEVSDEDFNRQMNATASAFAVDMLLLKFIQGLPVVGILGGAANPVYYNKVMKYVQLKYRKRYLLKLRDSVC